MSIFDGVESLSSLTDEEKNSLELFCQEKFVRNGEKLFSEGEDANAMYILKSGSFNITKYTEGKEISIGRVKGEEIIGEMAVFSEVNTKRMATATALEDSSLIVLLNFSIKELTQKHPELLGKIRTIIEERNMKNKMIA